MSLSQITTVKNLLRKEQNLNFTDEWFEACIDWVKENTEARKIDVALLKTEVLSQWLDVNLLDLGSKCLPADLANQKCVTLPGKYALQVNITEDIGESSYSQWNKLKKLESENAKVGVGEDEGNKPTWEPKPRRCLYLTMTDGTQTVYGMELSSIDVLNVTMKPGFKVMITGPVECRRGVIHLKSQNLRLLGGEVEGLAESNAFEHILKKKLDQQNQAREPLPRPTYTKPSGAQNSSKPKRVQNTQRSQISIHSRDTQPAAWNPPPPRVPPSFSRSTPAVVVAEEEPDPFGDEDDDAFMDIDESALMSQPQRSRAEASTVLVPPSQTISQHPTPATATAAVGASPELVMLDDDDDDEDFIPPTARPPPPLSVVDEYPNPPKKLKIISKSPYQYIRFIKENLSRLKVGDIVFVKACVATLVSSLSNHEGEWTLTVSLNDGSASLEAKMEPSILNKIIGFSFQEMRRLKADPSQKSRINQGLAQLTNTLVHMNGIFGIRILKPAPVIANFHEIQNSHIAILQRRLNNL